MVTTTEVAPLGTTFQQQQKNQQANPMQRTSTSRATILAGVVVATVVTMGCATAPLRTGPSTSGIRAAEEVGAPEVPQASLHLQLAREELDEAKALDAKGEHDRAKSMLMRSEADAELAVLLSRADADREQAQAAVKSVQDLRESNDLPAK